MVWRNVGRGNRLLEVFIFVPCIFMNCVMISMLFLNNFAIFCSPYTVTKMDVNEAKVWIGATF